MADLLKIVQDPNYVKANAATKRAIFDKYAPSDPNYAKATPATQKAIRQKYGVEPVAAAPAAPPETFMQSVAGGAASTGDIILDSALGTAQWLSYPFRRAAGLVTGETAEDIQASQERVQATLGAPVGRLTGAAEGGAYNQNMLRQAMTYIGENLDKGADTLAAETGWPKADVLNMMQSVMAAAPVKVPGGKTVAKAARAGVSKVQDIIDPRTKFYMDVADGKGAALLEAARSPEAQIVPGVRPTFAQATAPVASPKVAAVGEQAAKVQPAEALAIRDAQEAARVREIKKIERTPEKRKRAETVREKRSDPLYEEARGAGDVVDVGPTLEYIDDLIKTNPGNAPLLAEMRRIRKGLVEAKVEKVLEADAKGKMKVKKKTVYVPRENAEEIASSLDGIKAALADEKNTFIKKELTNIKDDLIEAIPSMKEAQTAFRKGSRPINQMDIGKYLREKLESPVPEGTQRAGVFAQAVRDAPGTIKRALEGQPRYKDLTEALSPAQQKLVDNVLMDLSRDARVKEMAQLGSEAAPKLKKTFDPGPTPNVLNRVLTVVHAIMDRVQGRINEKMAADIALELLDADRAAAALETAMQRTAKRQPKPKTPASPARRPVVRAGAASAVNQMAPEENRNRLAR